MRPLAESEMLCFCAGLSREELRRRIVEGRWRTVTEIMRHLPAGQGCATCHPDLEVLLAEIWGSIPPAEPGRP